MAHYFFHTIDGGSVHDEIGMDLPSHDAALREAIRYAGAVMCDQPEMLSFEAAFRVVVSDEDGASLFSIVATAVDTSAQDGRRDSRADNSRESSSRPD